MMVVALYLMVALQFIIWIISMDTVSLLWLGSSANFPPMCTKASLTVLEDFWISWINLSSLVVEEDILFMELMHISKASDTLSWRLSFLVAVFFSVTVFASSFFLLLSYTCLYCATLTVVSYITEVESGFLLVVVSSFPSFTFFS